MPGFLDENSFEVLKQSLPAAFHAAFINEEEPALRAFPLLAIMCKDEEAIAALRAAFNINPPATLTEAAFLAQARFLCETLLEGCNSDSLFKYRLALVSGEYPIHTRAINNAIRQFNLLIEDFHQNQRLNLDNQTLQEKYKAILNAILQHGAQCEKESLCQLLCMLTAWSSRSMRDLLNTHPLLLYPQVVLPSQIQVQAPAPDIELETAIIPEIVDDEIPNKIASVNPFTPNYNYNFNRAGRLASETDTLLLNAFGLKIGGHFDAQVKYPPKFIPMSQLHAIIHRQLSHRMVVPQNEFFKLWIEKILACLGLEYKRQNPEDPFSEIFVNPFLSQPISFLNPQKIRRLMRLNLDADADFNLENSDLDIVSQYIFELLQSFQVNPGLGLGIGANWDGTVNLSNEAGAYPFKFHESEEEWGRRFRQISLHRQGPSEAYMNAAKGIGYEVQALLVDFDYMSQLQATEYKELLYNAIIDNVVSDLFPDPAYLENSSYSKYRKQHVVKRSEAGDLQIESFYQASQTGTYFKDKKGNYKQTPMHRQAGTLEVQAFPKDSGCSENSRESYAGNPLAPLQLQYSQTAHGTTRGHIAYDPIGPDHFIPDLFYGQVLQHDDEDFLPYIGVVPKNFDKHFKQDNELCASFVIRMLQSSRIVEYSPAFRSTLQVIKARFLPQIDSVVPPIPNIYPKQYLLEQHQKLRSLIKDPGNQFANCEKAFISVFKNIVYELYAHGKDDINFRNFFIPRVTAAEAFQGFSRTTCDKLIRDLTINKPELVAVDDIEKYNATLEYLRSLVAYFYPKPTEETAKEIARVTRAHVDPLSRAKSIKDYFKEMRQIQQANLSRKQTPGMAYAAFKHGGPSKTITSDYDAMHHGNFRAGYRDAEGNQIGAPLNHEMALDWMAKKLGASLQLMHRYNLFAVVRRPLCQPYIQARQLANQHENHAALWITAGVLKGFLWNGLAQGSLQTVITPFEMLRDFAYSIIDHHDANDISLENPLAISAAPANTPGTKVKSSMWIRDRLLDWLSRYQDKRAFPARDTTINFILNHHVFPLLRKLYPHLDLEQRKACYKKIGESFPLDKKSWQQLFRPFRDILRSNTDEILIALIVTHSSQINRDFCHALFACISNPDCPLQPRDVINEMRSFHRLDLHQAEALAELVAHYNSLTAAEAKKYFLELFKFQGQIEQALHARDQKLQEIQNWALKLHDPTWIEAGHELLSSSAKIQLEIMRVNTASASIKDQEHRKWVNFAERELKHKLFSLTEMQQFFESLESMVAESPDLINKLEALKFICLSILNTAEMSDRVLNEFYISASCIRDRIIDNNIKQPDDARSLLNNFINVSMNAAINERLDKLDILADNAESLENPLAKSEVIELWLKQLQTHPEDLRALLEQQVQQSPSLDHSLWRSKCILQIVEKNIPVTERAKKTGMQSVLRFWTQHKENVTRSGELYLNPSTGEPKALSTATLFKGSRTLEYAVERVGKKVSNNLRRGGRG